ncbi:MAG: hypothetical protein HY520_03395 [Candidatus Aenigmarchaeota archaeon]|nr:hypothetical protein [Candidatus Aenigmarchaeota archaeon]
MNTKTQNTFKPFLVEGGCGGENIFRVVETDEDIPREQVEKLLGRLPIGFQLREESATTAEKLNEPLEVYVHGVIVSIYPPRHRILACTTFDSWRSADVVSRMRVDNVMDTVSPGHGQIRTCVHFDPKIFGIEDWPNTNTAELVVEIHVFPRRKESKPELEAPVVDVSDLLELIAGGEKQITAEQLEQWRELIMYAVMSMRACYENPDIPKNDPVRVYYKPCWAKIAKARGDEALISALEYLRVSIQCK